ncbi:hypothetical protein AL01_07945 [Bombella intestini]|uniref:Uncharacterized protein n=1 Tax=Bombella intestini TaxID=1539051 RepID=A0A1S8GP86_9PROT|nr:hypothetical protein [Bombella intestini]OOL17879.1 hypothetical protein AL01_07945 [Bombella intestini]
MKHHPDEPVWLDRDGQPISCTGKLRVLRENEEELRQVLRDACADALLMDVGPVFLRHHMEQILADVMAESGAGEAAGKEGAE